MWIKAIPFPLLILNDVVRVERMPELFRERLLDFLARPCNARAKTRLVYIKSKGQRASFGKKIIFFSSASDDIALKLLGKLGNKTINGASELNEQYRTAGLINRDLDRPPCIVVLVFCRLRISSILRLIRSSDPAGAFTSMRRISEPRLPKSIPPHTT